MGTQSAAVLWNWAVSMPVQPLNSTHDICRPGGHPPVQQKLSAWGESTPTTSFMHKTVFLACLCALADCPGTGPMLRSRRISLFATSELRRSVLIWRPTRPPQQQPSRWTSRCSSTRRRVQAARTRGWSRRRCTRSPPSPRAARHNRPCLRGAGPRRLQRIHQRRKSRRVNG